MNIKKLNFNSLFIFSFLFIGANTQAITPNKLLTDGQVCTIENGSNRCSVTLEWQGINTNNTPPPYCVFIKSTQQTWACTPNYNRADYVFVPDGNTTMELRSGSSDYSNSSHLDEIQLVGLNARVESNEITTSDIKLDYLKRFNEGAVASTWDGKVFFSTLDFVSGQSRIGFLAKVLRHKNLKRYQNGEINFDFVQNDNDGYFDENNDGYISDNEFMDVTRDKRIFSDQYLFNPPTPVLSSSERNQVPSNRVRNIKNYSDSTLDNDEIFQDEGFNLAVFPHPSIKNNPYRSNISGNPDENGQYSTYRLYGITASNKIGDTKSPFGEIREGVEYFIMGRFEAVVVVEAADTNHANIANVRILSPLTPLRDINGDLIHGYEMGVSLDGRMIVYSGNTSPGTRAGRGGELLFTYTNNAFNTSAWSVPKNISAMYDEFGPGRPGGEISVQGVPFSDRFPIAKNPIRDFRNNRFDANTPITGAYAWLSFDASEAMFSTVPGHYGASRHGTTLVGERTEGILYNIEGDVNLTRGNPTTSYDHFDNASGSIRRMITDAYNNLKAPNFNDDTLSNNAYEQVLVPSISLFGSSWDPFKNNPNAVLPLHKNKNVYSFIATGNRYVEVPLLDRTEDLLLYYPMNEPVLFDPDSINASLNNQINPEQARRNNVRFIANETADYSKYLHKGDLINGAQYPFEFNNVLARWANNQELLDIQEGAYGNSIYINQAGSVQTTIKQEAYEKIVSSREFSLSFWAKKNALSTGPVATLQGVFTLWLNNQSIDLTTFTTANPNGHRIVVNNATEIGQWNHYTVSYRVGHVSVYANGELLHTEEVRGLLPFVNNFPSGLPLILGPNGNLSGEEFIQMDEVYLYSTALNVSEVRDLAFVNEIRADNSPINTPTNFQNLAQNFNPNNNASNLAIRDLGEQLFNSNDLSFNRTLNCADCHTPASSFTDNQQLSQGTFGITRRNTPTLTNLIFSKHFFLDGRADNLEEQIIESIISDEEMGFSEDISVLISRLKNTPSINNEFLSIFGRDVNQADLAITLARYIRGIFTTPAAVDNNALFDSVRRGSEIFNNHGNCVACHNGPNFTDNDFHNNGLDLDIPINNIENGKARISKRLSDVGAFKTPTLRNIDLTAPYFHDGSAATLMDVVDHYNKGGNNSENQSTHIRPLDLNVNQKQDLVNFLKSLTSSIEEN